MAMRIAIVSDIHAGMEATAQDLCPREIVVSKQDKMAYREKQGDYLPRFISFITKEKIKADYLLLPGDITAKAHPVEAKIASECILKISDALSVVPNNILFVPGNHDACWKMHDITDSTGIMWSHRYLAFQSDEIIFSKINMRSGRGNLFVGNFFNLWLYKDLIVAGYNSSSQEMPTDKIRCGSIVEEHLQALEKEFEVLKLKNDKRVKVFMLHHHIHDFKMPRGSQKDYSLAHNGESLISLLQKFNFDLILHGHRHYSCLDAQNCAIPIFCAGSFSAKIASEWLREVSNQFHIIEIEPKGRGRSHIKGVIHSWSNTLEGWEKSPEFPNRPIVGYKRAFGASLKDTHVAQKVKRCILALARKQVHFSWKEEIEPHIADLKYLTQSRAEILDWCKEELLDLDEWCIFEKGKDDVFFCKK